MRPLSAFRLLPGILLVSCLLAPAAAQENAIRFTEAFDAPEAPALPAGWTADAAAARETSGSAASDGSGGNNLVNTGGRAGAVLSPAFSLDGLASATLRYRARRTATYARDDLIVTLSLDGGATFPVTLLAQGMALPEAASRYEEVSVTLPAAALGHAAVRLRFEAQGTSSGNARLDDVQVDGVAGGAAGGGTEPGADPVIPPPGETSARRFGFAAAEGTLPAGETEIELPLTLTLPEGAGLQGLQFRVGWDVPGVRLIDVGRGDAVADASVWMLSHEAGPDGLEGLLLGLGAEGLPPGAYPAFLVLRLAVDVSAAQPATEVHLRLSDVTGALALPTGEDAALVADPALHVLSLVPPVAYAVPSAQVLDFGTAVVGEAVVAEVHLTNVGGTRDLQVTGAALTNPRFTISPAAATVPPDERATFVVTFTPAATAFGPQEGVLTFTHDGADGPALQVAVTGVGVGGRGDADASGAVDVVDLVHLIDQVLGRTGAPGTASGAADVFPFPEGDARLDVRDLTVLAQAIVRGVWPDGTALPMVEAAGKGYARTVAPGSGTEPVAVHLAAEAGGTMLHLVNEVPIRALQLVLHLPAGAGPGGALTPRPQPGPTGAETLLHFAATTRDVRVLVFRADGEQIAPGRHPLGWLPGLGAAEGAVVRYAVAVDADRGRLPVVLADAAPGEEAEHLRLGRPYPHPFRAAEGGVVQVPLAVPAPARVRLAVYDLLGRRAAVLLDAPRDAGRFVVSWDGRDAAGRPVPAGLYVLRVEAGAGLHTRPLVVVR